MKTSLAKTLLLSAVITGVLCPSLGAQDSEDPTAITLERAVHFLAPDGSGVLVQPGTYKVESTDSGLQFIPEKGEAQLIGAEVSTHEEELDAPLVMSLAGQVEEFQDIHMVMLLLPGGQSLEAAGSYSGVRARALQMKKFRNFRKTKQREFSSGGKPDLWAGFIDMAENQYIKFKLKNRGDEHVRQEFVANIYINNVRKDTMAFTRLSARQEMVVTSTLARIESCKGATVRVFVDAMNVVRESNESNNKPQRIVVPPCPDLAVSKRSNGKLEIVATRATPNPMPMRYRLRIRVKNKGKAPMPEGTTVEVRSGKKGGKLRKEIHHIRALKPGEQVWFKTGPWRFTRFNWEVRMKLDPENSLDESNEKNNVIKWFGGGWEREQ